MVNLFRSLRSQLAVAHIIVLALGLGLLSLMTGTQMAHMTMESFTHEQQVTALVLTNSFSESLEESDAQQMLAQWLANRQHWRRELPEDSNLNVFDARGVALASSGPLDQARLKVNLGAVLAGDVVSTSNGTRLFTAVPVRHEQGGILGVVQIDSSLGPLQTRLWERWLALIGVTCATLALALVIAMWLASQLTKPLVELRGAAQQMATGNLDARVEVDNSVSELSALGLMFNTMADQLQGTIQQQRDFVANASHELRTPLSAIKLRAEALATQTMSGERAQQYAGEINSEVNHLASLVDDLLQLSHAERGTFLPPEQPITLNDELGMCVRIAQPQAQLKHQSITTQLANDVPPLAMHARDLRIMVGNLLDNAIKYCPEGSAISITTHWQAPGQLTICVCDTGPGVASSDLPHLGERFFRVDRAHNRNVPGMGLGLALTSAVAHQYQGMLTISSSGVEGEGTQATLSFEGLERLQRDIV